MIDDERDALIKLALIERPGKAEQGMRPNGERTRQAARKVDTNGFCQLGMRLDEGLDCPVADRKKHTRARVNEGIESWAKLLSLQAS